MGLLECGRVPLDGIDEVARQIIGWHLASFFVNDVKIERIHDLLQAVEHFGVDITQFFQRSVVGDQLKFAAMEIGGKMIHSPDCCLHLKQEWCVVAFMLLQLSAGVGNDAMLAIRVDLCEIGP